jgi:SAM-dependent methyltransferase
VDFAAERFTDESLAFWTPLFVELGRIGGGDRVLDVGCGTGGFALAIARETGARVVGCDLSTTFIEYAREAADARSVDWVVGDAASLPFESRSFDCVVMSLVLHQVADKARVLKESFRVLRRPGVAVVRTVMPEDAAERIPFRFFPTLAELQAVQMPSVDEVFGWARAAGFDPVHDRTVRRDKQLRLDEVEAHLRREVRCRYPFLDADELEEGLERMRAESRRSEEPWLDPRPTRFIVGEKY